MSRVARPFRLSPPARCAPSLGRGRGPTQGRRATSVQGAAGEGPPREGRQALRVAVLARALPVLAGPSRGGRGRRPGSAPAFPSATRVGTPAQPRTESGVSVRLSAAHVTKRDKHTLTEVVASPPAPHGRCFLGAWPAPGLPAATPPPGRQGASGKLRSKSGPPAQELPTTAGSKYELLSPA